MIGLDDSYLNDPEKEREIKEDILFECFQKAQGEKVEEGNVGIGRGLCAFGLKVGIGQSSRKVQGYAVGILVASNGGIRRSLTVDGVPVGRHLSAPQPQGMLTRSIVAVTATDAPLTPKPVGPPFGDDRSRFDKNGVHRRSYRPGIDSFFFHFKFHRRSLRESKDLQNQICSPRKTSILSSTLP